MTQPEIDYEGIRALYGRYSYAVDLGTDDEFADCFTENTRVEYVGLPDDVPWEGVHVGRDTMREVGQRVHAAAQGNCRHWPHIVSMTSDGDAVDVIAYYQVLRTGATPYSGVILTAMSWDRVIESSGRWYFESRRSQMDGTVAARGGELTDVLVVKRDERVDKVSNLLGGN